MDIRKYFTSPKSSSTESKTKDSTSTNKNGKPKGSSSPKKGVKVGNKRMRINSDSDEEPIPKKKDDSKMQKSPKTHRQNKTLDNKTEEKKKPISASAFFGSAPVRADKSKSAITKKTNGGSIHEDEDFEATLKQLDPKLSKEEKTRDKKKKELETNEKKKVEINEKKKELETNETKKGVEINEKKKELETNEKKKELETNRSPPPNKTESKQKQSKKRSSITMEFEAVTKPKKTIVVEEPKPAPKKHKGNAGYASYLGREGPKALGTKEIPEGEKGCLTGLTFVITGVLESIERDAAKSLIEKCGGKVMTTLSKNTKYMVVGRDAGSSKLDKAEKLGTKQVDEDGLFDLIRSKSGKKESKTAVSPKASKSSIKADESEEIEFDDLDDSLEQELANATDNIINEVNEKPKSISLTDNRKIEDNVKQEVKSEKVPVKDESQKVKATVQTSKTVDGSGISMWVDKYKPSSIKQIIGQQGDKSNAKKLLDWLVDWKKNRLLNKKPAFGGGRWNSQDDGSSHKAALLSGSPGVGKTTTAQLVCKEAGFEFFELNASDTRSKKSLQQQVSQILGNQTLGNCFSGDSIGKVSSKHAIIMDEVDGMAGNEDRGGMRELIDFIKVSKVPIICICNDRNHPKIRSLSNYCFDLRFQKPRMEQIKAAMMSVAFKEGIKVSPEALQDVIVASNQDIRQVLHNISMWSAKSKGLTAEQTKSDIGRGTKHIKLSPFDVLREVFAIGNKPNATIMDKSDLFFHDYSIAPLFVHENYLSVMPSAAEGDKNKHLTLLSEAADSICIGDIIDRQIRTQSSWSLLPTQAIFASVVPGELLRGNFRPMINFPAWLGKNSNKNHMDRVLQELHVHMRMKITGNKTDVALEYLPLLKHALTKPLLESEQEGVRDVLQIMEQYYLLREDFDSIIDLSLWPGQTDPRTKISPKVKSAFTRAYNKDRGKNPYAVTNVKKKKGSAKNVDVEGDEEEVIEEEEEEDDSIENDAMIKVKKPAKKNTTATEASTSKEKKKTSGKKGKSK